MVALVALLLLQQPSAASLDLWVRDGWRPWRSFTAQAPAGRDPLLWQVITWRDSAPGVRLGDFEVRASGTGVHNDIAVVELDPSQFTFSLVATPAAARRSIADFVADSTIVLVSNTGLFRPDGTTQGLALIAGRRQSGLAGWLDVVVAIEHGALRPLGIDSAGALAEGSSAFQVLPWLVRGGRVVFGTGSGTRLSRTHRDRRISLCFGADGRLRFVLSNFEFLGQHVGPVPIGLTIPEQAMIAAALDCRDAVALDGGISAQLAVRATSLHRMPGFRRVPLFLVARRRTLEEH